MKRVLLILACALVCLGLCACGEDKSAETNKQSLQTTADIKDTSGDADVQTADTLEAESEPEIIPDPIVASVAGEWRADLEGEAALKRVNMPLEELEAETDNDIIAALEGVTLPVYMEIGEDGSCNMMLKGDDVTVFVGKVYYAVYDIEAEFARGFEDEISPVELSTDGISLFVSGSECSFDGEAITVVLDGTAYRFERV